jgi:hypothetical protein
MGRPSPNRIFWVLEIQGTYVHLLGHVPGLPAHVPTPFTSDRVAKNYGIHIWVGEPHYLIVRKVSRSWLEAIHKGEAKVEVTTYQVARSNP